MGEVAIRTPQATERLSIEQVRYIASTEIVPKHLRGRPDAIMATILKGRALGLDDIHSLTAIHFIEGKATLAAETMLTLVRRRGHSVSWEAQPGESCTVRGKRSDTGDEGSVTWTMGMAKDAGLTGKDNWRRYPDQMLFWRASSQLCRMLFADVLMGVSYTQDEAEEAAERGRVTQAVADLPAIEEQRTRTEPTAGPSDAQLNRIARLEERVGDGYRVVLRGVFGVEMATELSADAAVQYEAMLELSAPPEDSDQGAESAPEDAAASAPEGGVGEEPQEDEAPTSAAADGASAGATTVRDEDAQAGVDVSAPAEDLFGAAEPEPVAEEVEGEAFDEHLVEIAGETLIPVGQFAGTKLADIHDSWLEYAIRPGNKRRLPDPFIEALDLWVQARKPEIWEARPAA